MNTKMLVYVLLGVIFLAIAIEQFIADITKIHFALNSWLSFIILLIGIFFIERGIKEHKKTKN